MSKMGELAIELDEEIGPVLGDDIPCNCCSETGACGAFLRVMPHSRHLIHISAKDIDDHIATVMLTPKQALQVGMLLQEAALDVRAKR